ncbi:MAG: lipoate--protein ligase family protein [Acidimicrobiia bacterium]
MPASPADIHNGQLHVVHGQLSGDAPLDTAVSRAILLQVSDGELPETLQVGTPHRVVAFGKHDTLSNGFDKAVGIAVDHGYDPTVRIAGGRAVVFSPTILRFAWTVPEAKPADTMRTRFTTLSTAVVDTLADIGVRGTMGEVPNEYCAGEYSVHIRGHRKVMGVGQRLTRSGAQVGGMIVVSDPDDINSVLVPMYQALDVPIDPTATGSIADDLPTTPEDVAHAFTARIAADRPTVDANISDATMTLARTLRDDHVPSVLA